MFNSKDNNLLYEAYASVYNSAEYLEEAQHARENPEKYEDDERRKMSKKQRAMNDPKTGINSPAFADFMAQQMGGGKKKKKDVKEDVYEIILSYLLDEGYADDAHSAVAIMGNMSEEWRESIVEGLDKDFASMRKRGGRSAPPEERSVGGERNRKNKDYWADVQGKNRDRGSGNKAKRRAAELG